MELFRKFIRSVNLTHPLGAAVENSYLEDAEIEIVGDTEMDKKNAEKVDKNFSKMTL